MDVRHIVLPVEEGKLFFIVSHVFYYLVMVCTVLADVLI